MSNPSKRQGTDFEVYGETWLQGLGYEAELLRVRGINDVADIRFTHPTLGYVYVESKHRQAYNPHKGLAKALTKLRKARLPGRLFIHWKRTTLKEGNERRTPDGPNLVIMDETFAELLLYLAEFAPPKPTSHE